VKVEQRSISDILASSPTIRQGFVQGQQQFTQMGQQFLGGPSPNTEPTYSPPTPQGGGTLMGQMTLPQAAYIPPPPPRLIIPPAPPVLPTLDRSRLQPMQQPPYYQQQMPNMMGPMGPMGAAAPLPPPFPMGSGMAAPGILPVSMIGSPTMKTPYASAYESNLIYGNQMAQLGMMDRRAALAAGGSLFSGIASTALGTMIGGFAGAGIGFGVTGGSAAGALTGADIGASLGGAVLSPLIARSQTMQQVMSTALRPAIEGMIDTSQMRMGSRSYLTGGPDVGLAGRGLSHGASAALVRDLGSLAQASHGEFTRRDMMDITSAAGDTGLLEMAQNREQITSTVKKVANLLGTMAQITGDPDFRKNIQLIAALKSGGVELEHMNRVVHNLGNSARGAGTTVERVLQEGGAFGQRAYQGAGMTASSGIVAGAESQAMARQAVSSGAFTEHQLALMGGEEGLRDKLSSITASALAKSEVFLPALLTKGEDGKWHIDKEKAERLKSGGDPMLKALREGAGKLTVKQIQDINAHKGEYLTELSETLGSQGVLQMSMEHMDQLKAMNPGTITDEGAAAAAFGNAPNAAVVMSGLKNSQGFWKNMAAAHAKSAEIDRFEAAQKIAERRERANPGLLTRGVNWAKNNRASGVALPGIGLALTGARYAYGAVEDTYDRFQLDAQEYATNKMAEQEAAAVGRSFYTQNRGIQSVLSAPSDEEQKKRWMAQVVDQSRDASYGSPDWNVSGVNRSIMADMGLGGMGYGNVDQGVNTTWSLMHGPVLAAKASYGAFKNRGRISENYGRWRHGVGSKELEASRDFARLSDGRFRGAVDAVTFDAFDGRDYKELRQQANETVSATATVARGDFKAMATDAQVLRQTLMEANLTPEQVDRILEDVGSGVAGAVTKDALGFGDAQGMNTSKVLGGIRSTIGGYGVDTPEFLHYLTPEQQKRVQGVLASPEGQRGSLALGVRQSADVKVAIDKGRTSAQTVGSARDMDIATASGESQAVGDLNALLSGMGLAKTDDMNTAEMRAITYIQGADPLVVEAMALEAARRDSSISTNVEAAIDKWMKMAPQGDFSRAKAMQEARDNIGALSENPKELAVYTKLLFKHKTNLGSVDLEGLRSGVRQLKGATGGVVVAQVNSSISLLSSGVSDFEGAKSIGALAAKWKMASPEGRSKLLARARGMGFDSSMIETAVGQINSGDPEKDAKGREALIEGLRSGTVTSEVAPMLEAEGSEVVRDDRKREAAANIMAAKAVGTSAEKLSSVADRLDGALDRFEKLRVTPGQVAGNDVKPAG